MRDFKGVWVSREIYLAKDLSPTEKFLLVEIDSLSKLDMGCFASNEYFAEFLQVSEKTISRSVKKFSEMGYITVTESKSKNGTLRTIKVNYDVISTRQIGLPTGQSVQTHETICPPALDNLSSSTGQFDHLYNTYIYNTNNNTSDAETNEKEEQIQDDEIKPLTFEETKEIFNFWKTKSKDTQTQFNTRMHLEISQKSLGYSKDHILRAVAGVFLDDFMVEKGLTRLSNILKNSDTIGKFASLQERKTKDDVSTLRILPTPESELYKPDPLFLEKLQAAMRAIA